MKRRRTGVFRGRYSAAKDDERCHETVVLKDGSNSRCMRPSLSGKCFCWQHSKIRGLTDAIFGETK